MRAARKGKAILVCHPLQDQPILAAGVIVYNHLGMMLSVLLWQFHADLVDQDIIPRIFHSALCSHADCDIFHCCRRDSSLHRAG